MTKCVFTTDELEFLGHKVKEDWLMAKIYHVHQVIAAAVPRNKKELTSFLGVCNWLSEYIPDCSSLSASLIDRLKQCHQCQQWEMDHRRLRLIRKD